MVKVDDVGAEEEMPAELPQQGPDEAKVEAVTYR